MSQKIPRICNECCALTTRLVCLRCGGTTDPDPHRDVSHYVLPETVVPVAPQPAGAEMAALDEAAVQVAAEAWYPGEQERDIERSRGSGWYQDDLTDLIPHRRHHTHG